MKKYIAVFTLSVMSICIAYSQSIIINNTSTSALVIDPLQNTNGTTGIADDVVILTNGNVGIGTSNPAVKLDIRGTLRIVDGLQSEGAFLVSDDDGVGTWYGANLIGRRVVWGSVLTTKNLSSAYQDITSTPLDLAGGLWMIVAKADIIGTVTNTTLTTTQYVWLKIVEELTDTDGTKKYTDVSEGGLPYSIKKGIAQNCYSTPMVQGFISIPVEGLKQKQRKYYVQAKSPSPDFASPKLTSNLAGGAYFYAIKLQ